MSPRSVRVRPNFETAFALAGVLASAATLAWGGVDGPSSLTAGLPREFRTASETFNAKVQKRFPPGATETSVIAELSRQGFKAGEGRGNEKEMFRRRFSLICNLAFRVYWTADAAGRVSAIRGVYREEGCL
jgi:hypothetical protein